MIRSFFRSLSVVSVLALAATLLPPVTADAAAFTDVRAGAQFSTAIEALKNKGVVEGYADGSFQPDVGINRAEFLKIVLESRDADASEGAGCFPDVGTEWFARFVCTAKNEGIIAGYPDGRFRPDQRISFVEAAKILSLAFGQSPRSSGGEWYEGYARALEDSRAIPTTITKLDKDVTRGEMAEMLWRLTEEKTDQPTKGLLNIQRPALSVNTASDDVQKASSCDDLAAVLDARAAQGGYGGGTTGGVMMMRMAEEDGALATAPAAAGEAAMDSASANKSGDYSETNVQVEGVDEADIVKTDGANVYLVRGQTIRIVRAVPADQMKEIASVSIDDEHFSPTDLYVAENRLIVIGTTWKNTPGPGPVPFMKDTMNMRIGIMPPYYGNSSRVSVKIFDVSDPAKPSQVRALSFDGSSSFTRRIDDRLYVVVRQDIPWYAMTRDTKPASTDLVPLMEDSVSGEKEIATVPCNSVSILPRVDSASYIVVASIPVSGKGDIKRDVVLGSADAIYASLNNIYVTQTEWMYHWNVKRNQESTEKTRVFRFALTGNGNVEFKADGTVPGHILNQFSMDESGGYFRIATETNSWDQDRPSATNLYVLDMSMNTVGKIEGIAPGEHMYAARFMGKRAYLVTFKTVDPLFVVDLSDPKQPSILGKLKIPGYSNYLHPYDDTHLIGFGKEVDESIDIDKVHSDNAIYYTAVLGVKVAMFDVSDVEHPQEVFKEVIGGRGSDSPVLSNHRALLFDKERGFFAFPVTVTSMTEQERLNGGQGPTIFQGAYVYDVSLKNGFELRGTISHYDDKEVYKKAGDYWYNFGKDVERILRISNSLISVSQSSVRSHSLDTVEYEGGTTLAPQPGWEPGQYWEE